MDGVKDMPVNFSDFMKEMGTLNAYTPGATTNSSPSSKLSIAKPGGTGTTRPPVKPNPAAPTPTKAGTVSEREVYNDSKRFKQQDNALEIAKLQISGQLSAKEMRQKADTISNAFTMANRELDQRRREADAAAANNRAQIGVQASKVAADRQVGLAGIESGEKLGMAEIGAKRYGIDAEKQIAKMTDSTTRLRDRQNFDLGKLTLESNEHIKSADRIVQERTGRNSNMTSLIASWGV